MLCWSRQITRQMWRQITPSKPSNSFLNSNRARTLAYAAGILNLVNNRKMYQIFVWISMFSLFLSTTITQPLTMGNGDGSNTNNLIYATPSSQKNITIVMLLDSGGKAFETEGIVLGVVYEIRYIRKNSRKVFASTLIRLKKRIVYLTEPVDPPC